MKRFLLLVMLLLQPVFADATHTPKPGSAERKAIMDALRPPVSKTLKRKVIFRVGYLRVRDGWALMEGNALKPDGSELGDAELWGELTALLRQNKGRWRVLHWGLATDTSVLEEARKKYPQAPRSIFPN